jgi:hypothetical protein
MFGWLRRLREAVTPEEANAALLRAAKRRRSPLAARPADPAPGLFAVEAAAPVLFPSDVYPGDGGSAHHGAHAPCDSGHSFGCDASVGSHH